MSDIRFAARLLVKDKAFTLAAVVALALGIAANNTVFTLMNGIFFRDLPFESADRIVAIGTRDVTNTRGPAGASLPDLEDWRLAARSFDGIGAFNDRAMNVGDDRGPADRLYGSFVSANAFDLIGGRPALGRGFTANDDRAGAEPVVILGHALWGNRYQSDPAIIGRTIRVNGVISVVIGVMPEGFAFPEQTQLWMPLAQLPADTLNGREQRTLSAFGRLAPGVSLDQARADLAAAASVLARQYPDTNRNTQATVRPYRERNIGRALRVVFTMLTGAVVCVLLIACANVANLLLARAAVRSREISLRMSMGASRWRVIRQLLAESVLLALLAGAVGLALSVAGVRMFSLAVAEFVPYWVHFPMDGRVFAFFATLCLGTSILFGLVPAIYTSRTNIADVLNEAGRSSAGSVRGRRWTTVVVTGQLALTLVLLSGAGLMIRGLVAHLQTDAGVDPTAILQMRLDLNGAKYATAEQRDVFYRQLEAGLSSAPRLRATFASAAPRGGGLAQPIAIEGRSSNNGGTAPPTVSSLLIGPGYFETLGTRAIRGRPFTGQDGTPGHGVVIVNDRFASVHFHNEDAVGHRIRLMNRTAGSSDPEWLTIVGVAPNVRQRPTEDGDFDPVVYLPYARNPLPATTILARAEPGVATVVDLVRSQVNALDPDLPLFDVMTLENRLSEAVTERKIFGTMLTMFATIALALAAVGLYAVTAYSVSQRTREIGIRIALGAQVRQVYWLVTRSVALQLGVGLLLGVTGGLGAGRLVQGLQSEVSPADPMTFGAVGALLVVVALVACLIPARRATRLDPVTSLRTE